MFASLGRLHWGIDSGYPDRTDCPDIFFQKKLASQPHIFPDSGETEYNSRESWITQTEGV
jgi:hypothetical protein